MTKSFLPLMALLGAVSLSTQAAIIFDNFGPGNSTAAGGRLLQGEDVGTIGNVDQAVSFQVGPVDYVLTQITAGIDANDNGGGLLDLIIAADNGGEPGAELETLSLNVPDGSDIQSAGASATTILSANTVYWVIADARGTFDGGWRFNDTGDIGLTAGRSAIAGTEDYGAWNLRPNDDRMALRVVGREAERTPDGGSTLLCLSGAVLGLLSFRKHSR